MGDPHLWRKAVQDHEFLLPKQAPEHNYLIHSSEVPLPPYVQDIQFDGIVLGPTFLCNRYKRRHLDRIKKNYAFIRDSDAFKIALQQDDYNCSHILDDWLVEWRIDLSYPVINEKWDLLYPKYSKTGKLRLGYTSYIHEEWIDQWKHPKPFNERSIDVSYRSGKLAPSFGRIGYEKGIIGDRFIEATCNENLRLDISTSTKDMIPGDKWHHFIENSKFCLGSNSGSSLIDTRGGIRRKTNRYLAKHPDASFQEVEAACFLGEDGKHLLTAISPRAIEAGLALTTQISIPGSYSNILRPDEHYIPLGADCSNIKEVLQTMRNIERVNKIAQDCKDTILSYNALRAKEHAKTLINSILNGTSNPKEQNPHATKLIRRYNGESAQRNRNFWRKRRLLKKVSKTAKQYGGQRLINFLNI